MRITEISEDVYQAIAERGKFGETVDDVLRRVFGLPSSANIADVKSIKSNPTAKPLPKRQPRTRRARQRMSSYVEDNALYIIFEDGVGQTWELPDLGDKARIRAVRSEAIEFARKHGATDGQQAAVLKALTNAGYYLIK